MALKAGKILSKLGSIGSSKTAIGLLGAGALTSGFASVVGPATMDASMDVAFGTPNADRYFTGRDMSLRGTLGAAMGGPIGGALMSTAPGDFFAVNPAVPSPAATIPIGTAVGAMAGATAGGLKGSGSIKSRIFKGALGAVGGGMVGGTIGAAIPAAGVASYMSDNRQFFSQSPYAPSSARTMADLHATGDVVLGMHNARRGY